MRVCVCVSVFHLVDNKLELKVRLTIVSNVEDSASYAYKISRKLRFGSAFDAADDLELGTDL